MGDGAVERPVPSSGSVAMLEARDASRAAYFDLLRQLQSAVRTVILAEKVSNSCVRCSDGHCGQLLRLICSCLLAGCRRFPGADPEVDELLFLLIVPEFIGAFSRDLDFVAYLCANRAAASFVRQLFGDAARVAHFYTEYAIMRDEELHLLFVSSLLAIEPVNFHIDSPSLAQRCLSASLEGLHLQPVHWSRAVGSGAGAERGGPGTVLAKPDRATSMSGLAARLGRVVDEVRIFHAFLPKPQASSPTACQRCSECLEAATTAGGSGEGSRAEAELSQGGDSADDALASMAKDLDGGSGDIARDGPEQPAAMDSEEAVFQALHRLSYGEALLKSSTLADATRLTLLEDEVAMVAEQEAELLQEGVVPADADEAFKLGGQVASSATWSAADLAVPLGDPFGLDVATAQAEAVPPMSIGLRDLGAAGRRRSPRLRPRPPPEEPPPDALPSCPPSAASGPSNRSLRTVTSARSSASVDSPPGSARNPRAASPSHHTAGGSSSGAEADKAESAEDAVSSLEGLWVAARRQSAQRLMRSASVEPLSLSSLAAVAEAPGSTGADLHGSSTPPCAVSVLGGGSGGRGGPDDATTVMSDDSDPSEHSSGQSVSTASLAGSSSRAHEAAEAALYLSPSGVHFEWRLSLRPRRPQPAQLALQRGLCPGCKERLSASFFNAPRYCHYLCAYFCTNCHIGHTRIIPARVAERWDFEPRRVCRMSAEYLDSQADKPLVPITRVKRKPEAATQAVLSEVHSLRQRLTRIREILAASDCGFLEFLRILMSDQVEPHVARGHDFYSIKDLLGLERKGRDSALFIAVARLVSTGEDHLRTCSACQADPHFCPICASKQPLFVFDLDAFYQCTGCRTVYHKTCFQRANEECPFCLYQQVDQSQRRPSISQVRPR